MTELEKIAYAKSFIDKLANGINPLDETPIPDDDIVNNVRLSRCFFYVSSLLQKEIDREQGAVSKMKRSQRIPFSATQEQLEKFEYSSVPITVSEIARRIFATVDNENMKKLSYRQINQWLLNIEMLYLCDVGKKKPVKRPTEEGRQIGITVETRIGYRGKYQVVLFNEDAQRFILDNLDAVIDTEVKKSMDDMATQEHTSDDHVEIQTDSNRYFSTREENPQSEPEKVQKACRNCRFQLSGECSSWEPCDEFQPIYQIPQSELDNWPTEGDATRFKQKWKKC